MSGPAQAQNAIVVGGPVQPLLRSGTEVPVRLMTELTTKNKALRVGQPFPATRLIIQTERAQSGSSERI
jgi:hypothetical protein